MATINQGIRVSRYTITIDVTPAEYVLITSALQTEAAIADVDTVALVEKLRDELERANVIVKGKS